MTDPGLALGAVRRMDRVVLATLALVAGLLADVPGQAFDSLALTLDALVFIAPFLLASVLTVLRYLEVISLSWPTILNAGMLGALVLFFVSENIWGKYFGEQGT